jgi:hypothetical protein
MWNKTWLKITENLSAFWECLRWKTAGIFVYVSFRYIRFMETLRNIIIKVRHQLIICGEMAEQIRWRTAGILVYLRFRQIRFSEKAKIIIHKIINQLTIDGRMAKHGSLFFSVSMILFTIKQPSADYIWWKSTPMLRSLPSPTFSINIRTILFFLCFVLIWFIMYLWKKYKLNKFKSGALRPIVLLVSFFLLLFALWIVPTIPMIAQIMTLTISILFMMAVFFKPLANNVQELLENQLRTQYWLVFLCVYLFGWIRGLVSIPGKAIMAYLVFIFGAIWFFVIALITFWNPRKDV